MIALAWVAAFAEEPPPAPPAPAEEVVIHAEALDDDAEVHLDRAAIEAFPASSADGLMRAVPGVHLSAHGGRGKAYQYFLRGFDAVHGADLAVDVEGVPLNEPSNIHANGYLDAHVLPTSLLRGLDVHLGAHRAEAGDFAIAADATYRLGLDDEGVLVEIGGGTDKSGMAVLAWRPRKWDPGTFLVAEASAGFGVGEGRAWRQFRAAGGIERWVGPTRVRAFVLGYDGAFESPGVLREDDLDDGTIGFWRAYDVPNHGRSSRAIAAIDLLAAGPKVGAQALAWGQWRGFELVQNFTGWWREPDHGDTIWQSQQGGAGGLRLRGAWRPLADPDQLVLRGGLDGRLDTGTLKELGIAIDESPWEERIGATFLQGDVGAWAEVGVRPVRWLHIVPGLRAQGFAVRLDPHVAQEGQIPHDIANSIGGVLAPKGTLTVGPHAKVSWIVAGGRGFRPPEALGIADGDRLPIATADTVETTLATHPIDALDVSVTGYATFVANEIVFDHAAARFLATGSTRRIGGELVAAWRPVDRLVLRLDGGYTDGRYTTTGEALPYAPRVLASIGAYTDDLPIGPTAWTAGIRSWFLGPRPIPGGFQSHSALVIGASARGTWKGWLLDVDVDNLLASKWRDGEFVFPSWFDIDEPRSELSVRHVTAGEPFALRVGIGRRFR